MENFFVVFLDQSSHVYQSLVAIFLGVFIGLRRETDSCRTVKPRTKMMGIRTTSLLVLMGTVSTFFSDIAYLPMMISFGVFVLIIIAYINGVFRLRRYGLTSEVSAILMFLIGILVGQEKFILAIVLAVILGISGAYKEHIHSFAEGFSLREWSGTLQLFVITALVLPFLPKYPVDPWGVFVPFDMWVLVILIAAIGFVGYFFNKYFGEKKSIIAVSFLGSLVSSTVTTTSLAQRSHSRGANHALLLTGVMLSIAVMQTRVLVEIFILAREVHFSFIAPVIVMMSVSLLLAVLYYVSASKTIKTKRVSRVLLKSPFELLPAIKFALFFTSVLFAIHFSEIFFGDIGAYITAFIASFADVDAVIFSALLSFKPQQGAYHFVAHIITISVVVNTFVKLLYIFLFGKKVFFRQTIMPILLVGIAGVVTALFV